jgi:aspartate-semialdehyde dehydrogenase
VRLNDIVIVGASGLVGRKILQVLHERNFPLGKVITVASPASEGKEINVNRHSYKLQKLSPEIFKSMEFAFFSAGGAVSKEWAPVAAKEGVLVIDNSSTFRMEEDVPLVVPEVNRQDIFRHKGIIANPNCSTIQLVMVLKPLDNLFKIKRIVVSTYQSVTGIGKKGLDALDKEIRDSEAAVNKDVFPHKIAYNAIPQVDVFFDDGYTKEEWKMMNEARKILGRKDMKITATCVRIPTIGGHGESVNIEFDKKVNPSEIRDILGSTRGIKVVDDVKSSSYPMPVHSNEKDDVYVGRIRMDESSKNTINLWIVADNVRKGAATNAVQIAEEYIKGK